MRPFFLVETIHESTLTNSPTKPIVEEYNIPDKHYISLHALDTYIHEHRINNDKHIVYMCAGKLLTEHTDIDALTYPIVGYIVSITKPPNTVSQITTQTVNRPIDTTRLETATNLVSRINNLLLQVNSMRNSIDMVSPVSNPNLHIHSDVRSLDHNADDDNEVVVVDDAEEQDDYEDEDDDVDADDDGENIGNEDGNPPANTVEPVQIPVTTHVPVIELNGIRIAIDTLRNNANPQYRYQQQFIQMQELGFTNMVHIMTALEISQGDVDEAVTIYFTLSET
jgi:hypothetical protein